MINRRVGGKEQIEVLSLSRSPAADDAPDDAFASIYGAHFDFVWRLARALGVEPAGVDDLVHEVFLVVRRRLDRYHLLLAPRVAALLTVIVIFLVGGVMLAGPLGVVTGTYVALLPLIILTHMVERFWTVEAEDGAAASFKTLLGTVVVAVTVSLVVNFDVLANGAARLVRHAPLVSPGLVETKRRNVEVERVSELCRGRTVVDLWLRTDRLPNAHVGVDLDGDAFFDLLVERIARLG